jgi:hypothetical protein
VTLSTGNSQTDSAFAGPRRPGLGWSASQGYEATLAARQAAREEARAAAKAPGRPRRNPFPVPEASRNAGEGIQRIREENRRELAETEKRDATDS